MAVGTAMTVLRTYFDRASFLALGCLWPTCSRPVYLTPPILCQLGVAGAGSSTIRPSELKHDPLLYSRTAMAVPFTTWGLNLKPIAFKSGVKP